MKVGAIDCGTNSTRLLIREGDRIVERLMTITRLGAGVDRTRRLAPDAIARTIDVLSDYRITLDEHGVERVRMTATSAARDAANREEFFDQAERAVGARPELLSGEAEAALSFQGAASELDAGRGPFLVVDIGGGSTEFIVGTTEPEGSISLDIGCVRITEKYLGSDPPHPGELSDAISVVRAHLDDVLREVPIVTEAKTLVGLAGSVTTVAAVEIGLATYDRDRIHHFRLTKAAVEDVFRTLATESLADRIHNPGLERERADVIVGGALILAAVMRHFAFDECLVSEADILDGLAMSLQA
ncbi:MAG: exopolyphosphatase [Acidimicrobiales bacterium]